MDVQQIPSRIFCINYNGGFAVVDNTEILPWYLENNSGVQIYEESDPNTAYRKASNKFAVDCWNQNTHFFPAMPLLESVLKSAYRHPGFVPLISSRRFFATLHRDYVGIYDTIRGAVEFIQYFNWSNLIEFSSIEEAIRYLNTIFICPMIAVSAYVKAPIEPIISLPLNTAVQINYRQWWNKNMSALKNSPFEIPNFSSDPSSKDEPKFLNAPTKTEI